MEQNIITEYILTSPVKAHDYLWLVYNLLEETIGTETTKVIAYQMPTYKAKRNVIHFSAFTNHLGIYPGPLTIEKFKDQFGDYEYSKGTLKVKYSQELPIELIKQMALYSYSLNKE